jgi:hypothetical protein
VRRLLLFAVLDGCTSVRHFKRSLLLEGIGVSGLEWADEKAQTQEGDAGSRSCYANSDVYMTIPTL